MSEVLATPPPSTPHKAPQSPEVDRRVDANGKIDYLQDPRLKNLTFGAIKKHVESCVTARDGSGVKEVLKKEFFGCNTKFAIVSVADKFNVELDSLLDELGPIKAHTPGFKKGDAERVAAKVAAEQAEKDAKAAAETAKVAKMALEEEAHKQRLAEQAEADRAKFKAEQAAAMEAERAKFMQRQAEEKAAAEEAERQRIAKEKAEEEARIEAERIAKEKAEREARFDEKKAIVHGLVDAMNAGGTPEGLADDFEFNPPGAPPMPWAVFSDMLTGARLAFPNWKCRCVGVELANEEDEFTLTVLTQQSLGAMKGDFPAMGPFPFVALDSVPEVCKEEELTLPVEVGTYKFGGTPGEFKLMSGAYDASGTFKEDWEAAGGDEPHAFAKEWWPQGMVGFGLVFKWFDKLELLSAPAPAATAPAEASAAAAPAGTRYNTLRESPADAPFKLCVVQFKVPGAKNGGSDKGPDGNRIDSIPIANGVIAAGGACDLVLFDSEKNKTDVAEFTELTSKYDALIVRINPGQLSQGTEAGTQERFDDLMNSYISKGKLVWSSPKIQTQMGAKDALVNIGKLNCGLEDTYAYYSEEELIVGFKKCCAFQPRVIKQNRGSAGEGIWLCWLWDKAADKKVEVYPSKTLGESSLSDDDYIKLMEMNDNHVEYHTVKEFMTFCVKGPAAEGAGEWKSTFPGKYLDGGKAAGGQLVDQRLLPRIDEGEVRILMAGDTCQMAVHKKPMGGGLSAVGGNSDYTYYKPSDAKYAGLIGKLYADIPTLLPSLGLEGEPLPLLWTCDYIPKNPDSWEKGPYDRSCSDAETEYTVGEFNCSCVGISKFQAVCGGEKTLADVSDEDYFDACELTELMGVKAIEMLNKAKNT